jgi:hypothetical protein
MGVCCGALLVLRAVVVPQHIKEAKNIGFLLGVTGLTMPGASLWLICGSTPFPGAWTLHPVFGTVLLLVAGTAPTIPISRILSCHPMVNIGDWSYSIYLWHWPFIVFAVAIWPKSAIAGAVAAVVAPPLVVCLMVGPGPHTLAPGYESGTIQGSRKGDVGNTTFFTSLEKQHFPCTQEKIRTNAGYFEGYQRCEHSKASGDIQVALLGDSFSEQMYPGFAAALPDKNVVYYGLAMPTDSGRPLSKIMDYVFNNPTVYPVALAANWTFRQVPMDEFKGVLKRLTAAGKKVYVIYENPTFPSNPERCKFQVAPLVPQDYAQPADDYLACSAFDLPALVTTTNSVPGAKFISVADYFCQQNTCGMTRGNSIPYRDQGHLNRSDSYFEVNRILKDRPEIKG